MDSAGKPTMPAAAPADQSFPKSARIHSSLEFDELFQRGKVLADGSLVVHAQLSKGRGRIGISISKRVGNAPVRNRWKRLIREAYRRQFQRVPALAKLDIVVRPRRGAVPSYSAIEKSLAGLNDSTGKAASKTKHVATVVGKARTDRRQAVERYV